MTNKVNCSYEGCSAKISKLAPLKYCNPCIDAHLSGVATTICSNETCTQKLKWGALKSDLHGSYCYTCRLLGRIPSRVESTTFPPEEAVGNSDATNRHQSPAARIDRSEATHAGQVETGKGPGTRFVPIGSSSEMPPSEASGVVSVPRSEQEIAGTHQSPERRDHWTPADQFNLSQSVPSHNTQAASYYGTYGHAATIVGLPPVSAYSSKQQPSFQELPSVEPPTIHQPAYSGSSLSGGNHRILPPPAIRASLAGHRQYRLVGSVLEPLDSEASGNISSDSASWRMS